MRKITIGLSRHTKFSIFGRGIEFFQKTPYSHAYLKFHSNSLSRDLIYQASGLKVNFMNTKMFDSSNTTTNEYVIEVTEEKYNEILGFCVDQVGKPYGIKNIVGIVFYTVFGYKIIKSDKLESFICSELIGYVMRMAGILPDGIDLDYFKPKDVFDCMEKLN